MKIVGLGHIVLKTKGNQAIMNGYLLVICADCTKEYALVLS